MPAPTPIGNLPITLIPSPLPNGAGAETMDELFELFCQYVRGEVQQNVFILQTFASPPNYNAGDLIYGSTLGQFFKWNTVSGQYDILTQFQIGQVTQFSMAGDDYMNGWIVLDGRTITGITGLSATQLSALQSIYPNGTLPNIAALSSTYPYGWHIPGAFISGGFTDSERVTQAATGATAFIVGNQNAGTFLYIDDLLGHPSTVQNWVGDTSHAVFGPSGLPAPYNGPYPIISKVYVGSNINA